MGWGGVGRVRMVSRGKWLLGRVVCLFAKRGGGGGGGGGAGAWDGMRMCELCCRDTVDGRAAYGRNVRRLLGWAKCAALGFVR